MILQDNEWNSLDTIDVPQADDLNKVYFIVANILRSPNSANNDKYLASIMSISDRQIRYYKSAARILGFLDEQDRVTQAGINLVTSSGDFMDEIVTAFQYSHIGTLWSAYYRVNSVLDVPLEKSEVIKFLDYAFGGRLSDSTKLRRATTLIKWVNEYKQHIHTR